MTKAPSTAHDNRFGQRPSGVKHETNLTVEQWRSLRRAQAIIIPQKHGAHTEGWSSPPTNELPSYVVAGCNWPYRLAPQRQVAGSQGGLFHGPPANWPWSGARMQ